MRMVVRMMPVASTIAIKMLQKDASALSDY